MQALCRSFAVLFAASFAVAQVEPDQSQAVALAIDSGLVANTMTTVAAQGLPQVVWSTVVTVPTSSWLRVRYDGVMLAGSREPGRDGSFLRLTSMRDGAVQTQHLVHIGQWQDTSAYFNGDAVQIELVAHPGTGPNRLMIREVLAGPSLPGGEDTICGLVDDRVLSSDGRVARNQPTGCTSWMINDCNHCFLTAGHCAGAGLQVVEFNVPLSTAGGAIVHPAPSDQYAVDPASLQTNGGLGVGNDWTYFGVFANSVTSLMPYQANGGQAFDLLATPPAVGAQNIRVTGNGSTTAPVSPTWYLVQKTHVGPYSTFTGTTIQYATDTTGGNSGSPVILNGTNQTIGIHTHGGCTTTGGANSGTGSNHPGLQAALANPLGICDCVELEFAFPLGLPTIVSPLGGSAVRVQITGPVPLQPGTLAMHVTTSTGSVVVTPVAVGAGLFDATLPPAVCGSLVNFYFTAQGTNAVSYASPTGAPGAQHGTLAAESVATLRNYNFNTAPPGWSVINTALATGAWVRGAPIDPRGPAADFDGSGQCWVTGNVANEDVDGGPTQIVTETVNLATASDPTVHYAIWFTNDDNNDRFLVDASNNGGQSWVSVLNLGPFVGWSSRSLRVRDLFATPGQFVLRFTTADQPNDSVTEAALDAFRIDDVVCTGASWSIYGAGCAGGSSAPSLQLVSLPTLGGTFAVNVQGLGGGFPFMLVGLASENTPMTLPEFAVGCTLLARIDVAQLLTPVGSNAAWTLSVPNAPVLQSLRIYQQAFELGTPWTLSSGGVGEIH